MNTRKLQHLGAAACMLAVQHPATAQFSYQEPLQFAPVEALTIGSDDHRHASFQASASASYILWRSADLKSAGIPVTIRFPANNGPDTITDGLPIGRSGFYRLAYRPRFLPGDTDRDGIPDYFEAAHSPQLDLPDPPALELDPFDPTDATAASDTPGLSNLERYHRYLEDLRKGDAYSRPGSPYRPGESNDIPSPPSELAGLLDVSIVNEAASEFGIIPAGFILRPLGLALPGIQFRVEFESWVGGRQTIEGYAPTAAGEFLDGFGGGTFDCVAPCSRLWLAITLPHDWFEEVLVMNGATSSPAIEFPLVSSVPVLSIRPLDIPEPEPTVARITTSSADPRLWVGSYDQQGFMPPSSNSGNIDSLLTASGFLPLQELSRSNANDFGILSLQGGDLRLFDARLLSDRLTLPIENTVGISQDGAQIGTFNLTSVTGQATVSGIGATIDRDGTYPWIRDTFDPDSPAGSYPTANVPTGLRSDTLVQTRDAHLTAHSLEFICSAAARAPDDTPPTGIAIAGSTLTADGLPVLDPLAASFTYSADPLGHPLGYIHLLASDAPVTLASNTIEAATEITAEATTLTVDSGTLLADTPDGRITLHASTFTTTNTPTLTAGNSIKLLGTAAENPGEPSHAELTIDATAKSLRIDHVQTFAIESSTLTADSVHIRALDRSPSLTSTLGPATISASTRARLFTNHPLAITATTTVHNGQIATPSLTVAEGATLTLTGPDAAVYTNTHNYGRPGYGSLIINGTEINPPTDTFPAFHLRPHFDAP